MAAARKLSKTQYETLASFRYALRLFLRFSEDAAQASGLTPQQHQAMLSIKGYPERERVTVGELAERLQIAHHSAVGLIDRLVTEGYVIREQGEEDRRQVFIRLTPRAELKLEALSEVHRDELRRVGPDIRALLERLASSDD